MFKKKPILTVQFKIFILLFDLLFFLASVGLFYFLRMGHWEPRVFGAPGLWFISFSILTAFYILGAYDLDRPGSYLGLVLRQLLALAAGLVLIVTINYFLSKDRTGLFGRGVLLGSLVFFLVGSLLYRFLIWYRLHKFRESLSWLFIVEDRIYSILSGEIERRNMQGTQSFVRWDGLSDSREQLAAFSNKALGPILKLEEAMEKPWSVIVVGVGAKNLSEEIGEALMNARLAGNYIMDFSEFYESMWKKVPVEYLQPQWFVFEKGFHLLNNPLGLRIKRLIDVLLSLTLFLLTWPIMLMTACAVRLESSGPVFYRQIRTGKDEIPFEIIKFRSMTRDAERDGARWAQKNDSRVTRVGHLIRLLRIDELPQLWNVLRGDMSFIGPRPERPEFNILLAEEIPYYQLRHLIRPGISGWAQILYPYGASVQDAKEKLSYDLYYIKNHSLLLDLMIVLKTIQVVLFGKGR